MNKYELAQYLANLTEIFEFHERLGTTKHPVLMDEFNLVHAALIDAAKKDQPNGR